MSFLHQANVIILTFVDQRDRSRFLSNTALLCSKGHIGYCCCKRAVGETSLVNVYVTSQRNEHCTNIVSAQEGRHLTGSGVLFFPVKLPSWKNRPFVSVRLVYAFIL